MTIKFEDRVAASPNVPKYAVKSLATSIKVAANRTIYSAVDILNVRNYIQDRGYKMDILTIAEDIGNFAWKANKSFRFTANIVCNDLYAMDGLGELDGGGSLRNAVLEIIDSYIGS